MRGQKEGRNGGVRDKKERDERRRKGVMGKNEGR